MAIFVDKCAICGEKITADTPCLTTWGVVFPETHRLFQYCDTGFHQSCLLSWPDCGEYAAGYFDMWRSNHANGQTGTLLAHGERWFVGCGPFSKVAGKVNWPYYVQLLPSFFPIRLKCDWPKWNQYVAGDWTDGLIPEVVRLLHPIVDAARAALPDVWSLEMATRQVSG